MSKSNRPLARVGVRVSERSGRALGGKSGRRAYTDDDQRAKGATIADEFGLDVEGYFEEIDTSGTLPLAQRPQLEAALQAMERGEIQAIVFPYRDRNDRSIATMTEVVRRVDAIKGGLLIAGGSVLTHKTADQWARSVLESFANEMPARLTREKVRSAHEAAIADGIPPYPPVPGYVKDSTGRFVVVEGLREVIRDAFDMRDRAQPASINAIRRFLAEHGIKRSYSGVESMLQSETYIGNIKFGDLRNDGAFEGIIDPAVWKRVQGKRGTRGRQAKSERLLARQGVLVCGTCGTRMTATGSNGHPFYRCQHNASPDCTARATVAAERVEELVVNELKARRELARLKGIASADLGEQLHQAAREAEADLTAAIETFAGVQGLAAAQRRIDELTKRWESAKREAEHHDVTEGARSAMRKLDDWDRLTLEGRRAIIRATIARIVVSPVNGRGLSRSQWDASRVDVQFVS